MRHRKRNRWTLPLLGAAVLPLGGCGGGTLLEESASSQARAPEGPAEKAEKVDICHYSGNGVPHVISVEMHAVDQHIAQHGDHYLITYYQDLDGDGAGDPGATVQGCTPPAGYTASGDDCDDSDLGAGPDALETCDGVDNNCDGQVDEGVTSTFYRDSDGDGHGDPGTAVEACTAPEGHVEAGDDCDDADAANFPGNGELCDTRDNDCNALADDGLPDLDADGIPDCRDTDCALDAVGPVSV